MLLSFLQVQEGKDNAYQQMQVFCLARAQGNHIVISFPEFAAQEDAAAAPEEAAQRDWMAQTSQLLLHIKNSICRSVFTAPACQQKSQ